MALPGDDAFAASRSCGGVMFNVPPCMGGINCGDLGTWISSVASFAAVVVALYLARRSDKPRAKGSLSIVFITPDFDRKLLSYQVSNLGTHSLRIHSAFLELKPIVRWLVKWPSAIANNWQHPMNSRLPSDIQRGESFYYMTDNAGVFGAFLSEYPAPAWLIPSLIRAGVSTPWGPVYVKISKDVKKSIMGEIAQIRGRG